MVTKELTADRLRGLLLGTAVGDSLGLPAEGLQRKTIERLVWNKWRHRLFFGKGMISDDTEHTIFVSQALLKHGDDPERFQKSLAWKLRWWLASIPAGIGFGTLRSIIKLWLGFSPKKSGVYSAGNGPAMRCAIIGAKFADNEDKLIEFTRRSTELTHRDPKALTGALAISYAAKFAIETPNGESLDQGTFLKKLRELGEEDWQKIVTKIKEGLAQKKSVSGFAEGMGLAKGISGYIYHTVPVAIYSWMLNYGNFEKTLTDVLDCGGDTDTVGAITGALAGASVGESGIKEDWIDKIIEYPRSCCLLRKIGDHLAEQSKGIDIGQVRYFWPALLIRNVFFLVIVLAHGFLRLVPVSIRKLLIK